MNMFWQRKMGGNTADVYKLLLETIRATGDRRSPRGLSTLNLSNVMVEFEDPTDVLLTGIGRKLSAPLAAAESLQLVGGFSSPQVTVAIAPQYESFMDHGAFHGAYGNRTGRKMESVIKRLKQDPDTRRAVCTLWDDTLDLMHRDDLHDYPCTVSYVFERDSLGKLDLTVHMRSNDAWLGFPYDIVQHSCLQRSVAGFLGLEVGRYTHFANSMHLYERDLGRVNDMLDTMDTSVQRPVLAGGIGAPLKRSGSTTWLDVQNTARQMFYFPTPYIEHSIDLNVEELWMAKTMFDWKEQRESK